MITVSESPCAMTVSFPSFAGYRCDECGCLSKADEIGGAGYHCAPCDYDFPADEGLGDAGNECPMCETAAAKTGDKTCPDCIVSVKLTPVKVVVVDDECLDLEALQERFGD